MLLLGGDIHPCPGPTDINHRFSQFKKRGLHFIHLNSRSILPKIDEIRLIAKETKCACFCFSETWLDSSISDSEISIDNYSIVRKDRNRNGGGVLIYIYVLTLLLTSEKIYYMKTWKLCLLTYYYLKLNLFCVVLSTDHQNNLTFMIL